MAVLLRNSARIISGSARSPPFAQIRKQAICQVAHSKPALPTSTFGASISRRSFVFGLPIVAAFSSSKPAMGDDVPMQTAASGMQFADLREGTGPAPTQGENISCHYRGTLTNGTQFDASYDRGKPLQFAVGVGRVIKGWDEGILGGAGIPPMKKGGKRKLIIPPEMAYGRAGAGGVIPPNATLVFEVELQ